MRVLINVFSIVIKIVLFRWRSVFCIFNGTAESDRWNKELEFGDILKNASVLVN